MEKRGGNRIRLGIFVFVSIAFFTVGIYFIGQKQRMFARTFRIRTIYRDVNGLQPGNNVRFAGINVGNVEKITITSDTTVEVDMTIEKAVKKFIKKDTRASVGSEGLMGDKLVILTPGSEGGGEIANNDYVVAADGNNIDAIMTQAKVSAQNIAHITSDLSDIISNVHAGKGSVGKLFMDTVFAKNLDQTIVNARKGSGDFKDDMEAAKHNILLRGYFKKKEQEKGKKESPKAGSQ